MTIDPELVKVLAQIGEPTMAVPCVWKDKPAAVAVNGEQVIFTSKGFARKVISGPIDQASIIASTEAGRYELRVYGESVEIGFAVGGDADRFITEFGARRQAFADRRVPTPLSPSTPILIVTMNDIPGYEITEVHGDVFGLVVRARNLFANVGAGFRTISGGEVGGFTKLLIEARNDARSRLADDARRLGANAVVAMRFDTSEIGDIMNETAAYGTAVTITRRPLA